LNKIWLLIIYCSFSFSQFETEWVVEQYVGEWGHLSFDLNDDGFKDLTKQYFNSFAVYDGNNEWSLLWYLEDLENDYLSLHELMDGNNDGINEALVISTKENEQYTVTIASYNIGSAASNWTTDEISGYISWIELGELDSDLNQEIIVGINQYDSETFLYTSNILILDALTGDIEWESATMEGFIEGPSVGDYDGDNLNEFVVNRYDTTNEIYEFSGWELEEIIACEMLGDVNVDALINVLDVVSIVSCILGECDVNNDACSDMNGDEITNVVDIILVINIILGETVQEQAREITWNLNWSLDQDPFEWGFLYFDANEDSYPEVSKLLNNSVGLYDGTNEFSLIWGITNSNFEYLDLNEMIDANNNGIKEGIFVSSNIFSESSFNISSYNALENVPNWTSDQENGSLTLINYADMDGDHFDEVILGLNIYSVEDTAYTSQIKILDGITGNVDWQSSYYSGYLTGPYIGDVDGDGATEMVFNIYDWQTEISTLHAIGSSSLVNASPNFVTIKEKSLIEFPKMIDHNKIKRHQQK